MNEHNTATEKQIQFINSLMGSRVLDDDATEALILGRDLWKVGGFSRHAASTLIDTLKALPVAGQTERTEQTEQTPEGMHQFGGVIFKVQLAIHGSGNPYAKALVEDGDGGWAFEYAPGAVRNLSAETLMSLDEAKQFGVLYGTCAICARVLTNEESIAEGIGPVCKIKMM